MKKLFILFFLVSVGILVTYKPGDTISVSPVKTVPVEKTISSDLISSPGVKIEKEQAAVEVSAFELEAQFQGLLLKEVEVMLDELNNSSEAARLVELANQRSLSQEEKNTLVTLIRTKAALTKIWIEKSFEDLEQI